MKFAAQFVVLPLALLLLTGCPANWEQQTQAGLAASQAVINQAQTDYEASAAQPAGSCAAVTVACIPHTPASYTAINQAKQAQTLAVQAMETYEQLKASNAGATQLAAAQNDVATLLADIPPIITEVKALYSSK